MKTSHLFNSVKMIYNHMAQLIGFPTFWFNKEYEKWNEIWINEPEQTLESLKIMIEELLDKYHVDEFDDLLIKIIKHMKEQKETRQED